MKREDYLAMTREGKEQHIKNVMYYEILKEVIDEDGMMKHITFKTYDGLISRVHMPMYKNTEDKTATDRRFVEALCQLCCGDEDLSNRSLMII